MKEPNTTSKEQFRYTTKGLMQIQIKRGALWITKRISIDVEIVEMKNFDVKVKSFLRGADYCTR